MPILNDPNGRRVTVLDARLIGGRSTGDSTYWTALVEALGRVAPDAPIRLLSDKPAPPGFTSPFPWTMVPARSGRWWSLVAFPLAARRMGARAIHAQYSLSPLVGWRGVTTVHDVSFLVGPEWFPPRDRFLLSRTVPAACRRAARVVTVSETSKAEIERLIPAARGKTVAIPNACPPWIRPVADGAERRARLGTGDGYLLTVGTRWPRKAMEVAVAAAEGTGRTLVVTGKPGWGPQDVPPWVRATGYVDEPDLCALYEGAALYLAPSRHEGFGLPLLEAMRLGTPVLAAPGGAMPEVGGDAAAFTKGWDPDEWQARIIALLADPGTMDAMRRRGAARERTFSWEASARAHLAVYAEVEP